MANDVNVDVLLKKWLMWKNYVVLGDFNLSSEMKRFSSIMVS